VALGRFQRRSGVVVLTRRIAQLLTGVLVAAGLIVVTAQAANADYIYCPPNSGPCVLVISGGSTGGGGGGSGGGGGGSGSSLCLHETLGWISCYKAGLGWFNPNDSCYYLRLSLPIGDPAWGGNDPSNGDMYAVHCWGGGGVGWVLVDTVYRTSPPYGYGGLPSILSIAVRAINLLPIKAPVIETAPDRNGQGLVGLPVWMWTRAAGTWGTYTATASDSGLWVRATAKSTKIVWNMGNGTSVPCPNNGTVYSTSFGYKTSPNCGYNTGYLKPSRYKPGGVYTITATTTWVVNWVASTGETGTVTITRRSTNTVRIVEIEVVAK
jgi:hypothetical protein